MEVKTKRFIIRYNEGMVNVPAKNTEEAIAEFKKLGIETTAKEITIIDSDIAAVAELKLQNFKLRTNEQ